MVDEEAWAWSSERTCWLAEIVDWKEIIEGLKQSRRLPGGGSLELLLNPLSVGLLVMSAHTARA